MTCGEFSKGKLVFSTKYISQSNAEIDIHGICVKDDGKILLCDVNNRCILTYNSLGKPENRIDVGLYPRDIAIVPDTAKAVVTLQESRFSSKPGTIAFIDTNSMKVTYSTQCSCTPFGIFCANTIAVGSWNVIMFYDLEGGFMKSVNLPEDRIPVKFIRKGDNQTILYTNSMVNCISLDGSVIFTLSVDNGPPRGLCIDNGQNIYVSCSNGRILRYHGKVCDVVLSEQEGHGPLSALCLSHDYKKLYVATDDGSSLSVFDFTMEKFQ